MDGDIAGFKNRKRKHDEFDKMTGEEVAMFMQENKRLKMTLADVKRENQSLKKSSPDAALC